MKETMISARIPAELQKELEEYIEEEDVDRSVAVRKLLKAAIKHWKIKRGIELLEKGDISFTKAAKIADLDVWSFADEVEKSGVIWIKEDSERFRRELRRT